MRVTKTQIIVICATVLLLLSTFSTAFEVPKTHAATRPKYFLFLQGILSSSDTAGIFDRVKGVMQYTWPSSSNVYKNFSYNGLNNPTYGIGQPEVNSLQANANILEEYLSNCQETHGKDIYLIGHSLGGVVASYWAATHLPPSLVNNCSGDYPIVKGIITIDSPLNGVDSSDVSPSCYQSFIDKIIAQIGQFGSSSAIGQVKHNTTEIKKIQATGSWLNKPALLNIANSDECFITPQDAVLPAAKSFVISYGVGTGMETHSVPVWDTGPDPAHQFRTSNEIVRWIGSQDSSSATVEGAEANSSPTPTANPTATTANCVVEEGKVVVYEGLNYTGACKSFGVGIVDDLVQYGLSSNISSIKVPDTLTLFMSSGTHQGGTPSSWNQYVPDLSTHQWGNMAKSLKVEEKQNVPPRCAYKDTQVVFFTDPNFSGECVIKNAGEYKSPEAIGLSNDSISSIKVGSQAKVQVCGNSELNSPCQWFGQSITDLSTTSVGDNQISSAKVLDLTQEVTVCSDPNFRGDCKSFEVGSINDLAPYGLSEKVSSIKVPGNKTLFMFGQINLSGTRSSWNEDVADLSTRSWNDLAKSLKVERKLDVSCSIPESANGIILYRDPDYRTTGGCKLITESINDLGTIDYTRITCLKFVGTFVNTKRGTLYTDANYGNVCGVYTTNQSDLRNCAQQDIVSLKIEEYTPPANQAQNIAPSATIDPSGTNTVVDGNLDTQWVGQNKQSISFAFPSQSINNIIVHDRPQNSPDNNQINKVDIYLDNNLVLKDIDMTSGGPRCADVSFPTQTVHSVTVVPTDASGNNGYREVQIFTNSGAVVTNNSCVMKHTRTPVAETNPIVQTSSTPTPTPEPTQEAQQTQSVVFENFQSGNGWGLTNSQYAQEGDNQFLRMTPNIDAESWRDVGQAALQNYNRIQFRIRTNGAQLWANENSQIYLNQGGRKYYATLRDKVDLNNSDWQTIEISLSEIEQFGFDRNQSFDSLGFKFHYENVTVNIDVDDIVFLP